jgi:pimeloyl-[acyl-carrier protein] methyl ester esterase
VRLVFLHGWGFDADLWGKVRALLPGMPATILDRGYFGAPATDMGEGEGPCLAIGHSLGSLLLAGAPPADCVGLAAINGFDRFAGPGRVAPRLIDRMRRRFADRPAEILADFRSRCGADAGPAIFDAGRLGDDLAILAEWTVATELPVLVLSGGGDPIVPAEMRDAVFPAARRATLAGGGHLLPITHPEWCAAHIRELVA